jgi:hypothetical protein
VSDLQYGIAATRHYNSDPFSPIRHRRHADYNSDPFSLACMRQRNAELSLF